MRRRAAIVARGVTVGVIVSFAFAQCGGGGDDAGPAPERTAITAPATKAQTAVEQQNQQLREMEQRTSQADPTVP